MWCDQKSGFSLRPTRHQAKFHRVRDAWVCCEGVLGFSRQIRKEKPLQEKTHLHPQACYLLLLKVTRGRQTHRQHCIKFFSKKKLPAVRWTRKPLQTPAFWENCLDLCRPRLKFLLHDLLNWKIIKGVSGIVKGKTKLFLKKNLKYNKRGMNDLEICVDRAWLPRGFMWGLVCKWIQYRRGRKSRPTLILAIFKQTKDLSLQPLLLFMRNVKAWWKSWIWTILDN